MQRRVFMKNGAMALVTMGLSPSFLRRSIFAQELARGSATLGNARGKWTESDRVFDGKSGLRREASAIRGRRRDQGTAQPRVG